MLSWYLVLNIATLLGVPKYYIFRIRDIVHRQRVTTLVDGGATDNFIDVALVSRRNIPTKEFKVVVAYGYNMMCTHRVRGLEVTLGNYTLTDDFYVMDLEDTHVVLGVQFLYSLGDIHMNYKDLKMDF
jgi:hypothetical protein